MPKEASGDWSPALYERFAKERERPFRDLLALVEPRPQMRVIDLGCGTGKATQILADTVGAPSVMAVDSSEAMLAEARKLADPRLSLVRADIADHVRALPAGSVDLVFSNAALQFLPDHPALLAAIARALAPGGQIAIQVPRNVEHPSYQVANELSAEAPYADPLAGYRHGSFVLTARAYGEALWNLGFRRQNVAARIYVHEADSPEAALAWAKGGLMNAYRERLSAPLFARFADDYRERLLARLPARGPFPFTYERIVLWAQGPD
ncbi:MAG TPA: methyltransferase domain-containing protein [Kofleriaceae bacterium]|nr:methyltransferase domain-containing protein [Kofleriaceae bacterium]